MSCATAGPATTMARRPVAAAPATIAPAWFIPTRPGDRRPRSAARRVAPADLPPSPRVRRGQSAALRYRVPPDPRCAHPEATPRLAPDRGGRGSGDGHGPRKSLFLSGRSKKGWTGPSVRVPRAVFLSPRCRCYRSSSGLPFLVFEKAGDRLSDSGENFIQVDFRFGIASGDIGLALAQRRFLAQGDRRGNNPLEQGFECRPAGRRHHDLEPG